eukprot:5250427-Amphidinium_carterae.2
MANAAGNEVQCCADSDMPRVLVDIALYSMTCLAFVFPPKTCIHNSSLAFVPKFPPCIVHVLFCVLAEPPAQRDNEEQEPLWFVSAKPVACAETLVLTKLGGICSQFMLCASLSAQGLVVGSMPVMAVLPVFAAMGLPAAKLFVGNSSQVLPDEFPTKNVYWRTKKQQQTRKINRCSLSLLATINGLSASGCKGGFDQEACNAALATS